MRKVLLRVRAHVGPALPYALVSTHKVLVPSPGSNPQQVLILLPVLLAWATLCRLRHSGSAGALSSRLRVAPAPASDSRTPFWCARPRCAPASPLLIAPVDTPPAPGLASLSTAASMRLPAVSHPAGRLALAVSHLASAPRARRARVAAPVALAYRQDRYWAPIYALLGHDMSVSSASASDSASAFRPTRPLAHPLPVPLSAPPASSGGANLIYASCASRFNAAFATALDVRRCQELSRAPTRLACDNTETVQVSDKSMEGTSSK
jgi:hypothetical protein